MEKDLIVNFLKSQKLSKKLTLMVLIPLVIMLGFAVVVASSAFQARQAAYQFHSLVDFSQRSSLLVHELQKERGMTAGYIGSRGAKFADAIVKQRKLTDKEIKLMREFLSQFDAKSLSPEIDKKLSQGMAQLKLIEKKRKEVDSFSISLKGALGYYTNINGIMLGLVSDMSKVKDNSGLSVMTSAYANFLQSKERAGIERAVLANVFSRDDFGNLFIRFVNLVNTQENYINVFLSMAKAEDIAFYKKTMKGEALDQANAMRAIAFERAQEGGFGVDATDWFKAQTGKINLLKKVDNHLIERIQAEVIALEKNANTLLIIDIVIIILALAISLKVSLFITKDIKEQLGGEPEDIMAKADRVANGDLTVDEAESSKLTGINGSIVKMQKRLSRVITQDIQNMIDLAKRGELSHRIDLQGKAGFYESLSVGINELVETSEGINKDAGRVMSALAQGDLSQTIDRKYEGSYGTLKQDANATIGRIHSVVSNDIQAAVDAAQAGDLSIRIPVEGKEGFFLELSDGVNGLLEKVNQVFDEIMVAMEGLSQGKLTVELQGQYEGDFARIQESITATVRQLDTTVEGIVSNGRMVKQGAEEISAGNEMLKQRTELQAASLEETAASMEEITSTVKNNADNTQHANDLVEDVRVRAKESGEIADKASTAMSEINQSSHKISEIIGIIDDIAFQTNLLALNASVEAARAGEQGRGFSVVASEVRNLAQRSASAAKDIKDLIQDSVQKVEEGSVLVDESSRFLSEIRDAVEDVSNLIGNITNATKEQSIGISEINSTVTQMDSATQENAQLVEETAVLSSSLNQQANETMTLMEFFSTGKS